MVPISATLETTYEDAALTSDTQRLEAFGQHDHVRVYTEGDFIARLERTGFITHAISAHDLGLTDDDITHYGLEQGEKIFVGQRT